MRKITQNVAQSQTSPKGGRQGCLCSNGTYSIKCCTGGLQAQGIGNITGVLIPIIPVFPANIILPVISGATNLGSVLSSTTGTWTGTPAPTFAYQWRRGLTNITSATNSTYTLVVADSGQNITCVITATNTLGSANAISNIITAQTYSAPVNVSAPIISGATSLGSILSSTTGTFTGNPSPTYGYQWNRNGIPIASATTSTYTLVVADSAASITCVVNATNALGSTPSTSNTITAQTYSAPVNIVAPVISGNTTLGSVLTSTTGTWTGNPTPNFYYEWYRNGSPILGATNSTYTLVIADSNANIYCLVDGENIIGYASGYFSNTITAGNFTDLYRITEINDQRITENNDKRITQ